MAAIAAAGGSGAGMRGELMHACHSTGVGPDCHLCPMCDTGLCVAAGPAGREELMRKGNLQDFAANATVWDESRGRGCVGVVVSGLLRLQSYNLDGRRQILALYSCGDVIGDGMLPAEGCMLEAATPARICRFESSALERLVRGGGMARALYRLRTLKLDQLRLLTWALAALDAEERFCAFLAASTRVLPYAPLPARAGTGRRGGVLTLELPRADIADLLGTTVESISRISTRLDAAGVIRIRDARHFEIPDLDRLIEMGCLENTFDNIRFACEESRPRQPADRKNFVAERLSRPSAAAVYPRPPSLPRPPRPPRAPRAPLRAAPAARNDPRQ
ncbi:Crp/Fnr family transcriptional regulator [Acidimangrovimonas pyrenivorans]|uniref:Crp/Fnr family transcriptional regulator n=1 Tax=Acidimangrovimonas pyrenivorans TaxID=2030798 RepID=A0ABV7AIE2_9RHOB